MSSLPSIKKELFVVFKKEIPGPIHMYEYNQVICANRCKESVDVIYSIGL